MGLDGRRLPVELPTLLLGITIYGAFFALTAGFHGMPAWAVAVLGGWVVAWHGSLQHEAVHGHPTRRRWLDAAFAGLPLALWLPFPLYRESHLAHHGVGELTDPLCDPESFYVDRSRWRGLGPIARAFLWARSTLLGRLVLGPPDVVARLWVAEARRILTGDLARLRVWLVHAVLVAAVLGWVVGVCRIPLHHYVLLFVYPGLALTLLRSFVEHRPAADTGHRNAIVEAETPLGLLFLHNNLHAVHHAEPWLPWYRIPERYRQTRDAVLRENGGYLFAGYREVARRFLLRPKDAPVHPGGRG